MPLTGIVDPTQLAMLTAVLDDVCRAAGIEQSTVEREQVAGLVMYFYGRGYQSAEGLQAALDAAMREEERQFG